MVGMADNLAGQEMDMPGDEETGQRKQKTIK